MNVNIDLDVDTKSASITEDVQKNIITTTLSRKVCKIIFLVILKFIFQGMIAWIGSGDVLELCILSPNVLEETVCSLLR